MDHSNALVLWWLSFQVQLVLIVGFSGRAKFASNVTMTDGVDHPKHYTSHPSGIECIEISQHMNYCLGNVIKYVWRADLKNAALTDLKKAQWYLDREIRRREQLLADLCYESG